MNQILDHHIKVCRARRALTVAEAELARHLEQVKRFETQRGQLANMIPPLVWQTLDIRPQDIVAVPRTYKLMGERSPWQDGIYALLEIEHRGRTVAVYTQEKEPECGPKKALYIKQIECRDLLTIAVTAEDFAQRVIDGILAAFERSISDSELCDIGLDEYEETSQ